MAITVSISPTDTLCRSGQPMPFQLNIANTDGADRVVTQLQAVQAADTNGGLAANISLNLPADTTIATSTTLVVPFGGTFFASASNVDADSEASTVSFKVRVAISDADDVPASNNVTAACDMSVVPTPFRTNIELSPAGTMLDFESLNNGILYQLHYV